jgi:hypothetical protein
MENKENKKEENFCRGCKHHLIQKIQGEINFENNICLLNNFWVTENQKIIGCNRKDTFKQRTEL